MSIDNNSFSLDISIAPLQVN